MDRLTEIRTRIECYQNHLEDLEEITSALETSTGLGLFLQAESERAINNPQTCISLHNHEAIHRIKRESHKDDYIDTLLVLWARANAKIVEIAYILEESIGQLQNEEDEILADMEQSANRQSFCDINDEHYPYSEEVQ